MPREHTPPDGGAASSTHGRCPVPKVKMPERGTFLGVAWSAAQGAGNQIMAAELECEPDRVRLAKLWRPFQEAPGRRDVVLRIAGWLADEGHWAERRLTVGLDFPFSLAETHLRQLGVLRQAIAGPASLGRALVERYMPPGTDVGTAADAVRAEVGRDRPRVTECYRAAAPPGGRNSAMRRAVFGIAALSGVEASFLPWDPPRASHPSLVEVHPPHVARVLAGACGYRDGAEGGGPAVRAAILRALRTATRLRFEMEEAAQIVGDGHGFALDAVMAAVAAASAQQGGFVQVPHNVPRSEGWIYSVPEEPWRR
jgi:hypothetical protein